MNSWDDPGFRKAIEATGRKNIIMTGLWTEVCITWPTIEMLGAGYNIYVVEDCCGATSPAAQEAALSRMVQAGAVRVTTIARVARMAARLEEHGALQQPHGTCSSSRRALTASASNTPTRWFTTPRSRRKSRRLCRRKHTDCLGVHQNSTNMKTKVFISEPRAGVFGRHREARRSRPHQRKIYLRRNRWASNFPSR